MDGIHPKFVLSKRFPVHAAIEQLDLVNLKSLLTPASDARFHFGRKLTNTEVSVLHQACAARPHHHPAIPEIVKYCTALGAPVNDPDCIGQTPLFYAVTHCQATELVPILLRAGSNVNAQRTNDGFSALHVAAMVGRLEVANLLLQAGADTTLEDNEGRTAGMVAEMYKHLPVADCINSPREKYRPEFPTQYMEFLKTSAQPDSCTILYDEHLDWRDQGGASLLHVACWTGNLELFRAFCLDANGRKLLTLPTTAGLTPLMFAIINGQATIVEEYFNNRNSKKDIYFHKVVRDTKQTLLFLLFLYCPSVSPKVVLKRKDLGKEVVNAVDSKGNTALMASCQANCRDTVRRLLSSKAATERHLFDLSIANIYKRTALHILVMNNDKYNVRLILNLLEDCGDSLNSGDQNDLTPLMLAFNKGHYEVFEAIAMHPKAKAAINWGKTDAKGRSVRMLMEEVEKMRAEQKAAEVSKPLVLKKMEVEETPKRNFQEEMNNIYKNSQDNKSKRENAPNPANSLKKENVKPVAPNIEETKPKDIVKVKEEPKSNGVHINGTTTNGVKEEVKEEEDDGPSLADIRNQWRKKVPVEEHRKAIEEEVTSQQESILEDLMKKAEQKANESKSETSKTETSKTEYITEEMNEEISWALEMKKQQAESNKVPEVVAEKKREEKKELSQFEKMQLLKEKEAEEKRKSNAKPSDAESLANLTKAMEDKAERRKVAKEKKMEPEKLKQEEKSIEEAMSEEIQWALEQKRMAAEEADKKEAESKRRKLQEEEDERIVKAIKEKQASKLAAEEKEKAERLKKIQDEKERLARLQKEAEEKIQKARELKELKEKKKVEEEDSLAKLPRWKREKVLKEREVKAAKEAEEELKARMAEEMEWAENLKNQETVNVTAVSKENKAAEEEKAKKAKEEKEKKKKEEEKRLEEERIAAAEAEALERDKNPTSADLERRRQEDLEIQAAMAEEIQWALEQKKQLADEQKSKEEKEKETAEKRKRAEEEDKKIMEGILQKKKEKEALEKKKAKEEEEARILAEQEKKKKELVLNEKKKMEELEKKAQEKIEAAKKEAEKKKIEKQKKDIEMRKKEEEERKRQLEEDLRWAEEQRLAEEFDRKEKIRKEKERLEAEKKAKEDAEKEKQRQIMIQKEKEMLENLEKAAQEKLRLEKEEEELRVKKEQEAWEKMPKWKKDKILRERRASSSTTTPAVTSWPDAALANNSRRSSSAQLPQTKPSDTVLTKLAEEDSKKTTTAPPKPPSGENKPSNGLENVESVKIDINAIWNESIEASKSPSPAGARLNGEGTEDKFSEWLKQELAQADQEEKRNDKKVLETKVPTESTLKPPAPARRRRKPGQEEENDEAVVRPNRKSRVDDSNTEEPPKSPVAATRKTRRSPLPPPPSACSSPSKVDLANLIEQSSELEEEEARAELMMIIQAFFLEKRGKL